MSDRNKKIELLSPVGDMERLTSALTYGADAVYLAGTEFGMRTVAANFDQDMMRSAVKKAHDKNVPVYITCNTLPHNSEIERLPAFLEMSQEAGVDAFIVSDIGIMKAAQKYAPKVEIHISTQAGITNYLSAQAFYDMGASRVVVARELTLDEISEIRSKVSKELEIEAFVHGAMCVSFSGRCLLSSYMTGRDANRGDCAQPCRWQYSLMEAKRPGEYFNVFEDEKGTHIMNSRDMCMIDHIPELVKAGITSFKIEGRAKSSYYVAVTTNAYRNAIDDYFANPDTYKLKDWIVDEVKKISHRDYSKGFYFGHEPGQVIEHGGYVREYTVIGIVTEWKDERLYFEQRNRFFKGDVLDILEPNEKPYIFTATEIWNPDGESVDVAPNPTVVFSVPCKKPVQKGAWIRKKT